MTWTIGKRTFGGFSIILLLAILGMAFSSIQFFRLQGTMVELRTVNHELAAIGGNLSTRVAPMGNHSSALGQNSSLAVLNARLLVATLNDEYGAAARTALTQATQSADQALALCREMDSPEMLASLEAARQGLENLGQSLGTITSQVATLREAQNQVRSEATKMVKLSEKFVKDQALRLQVERQIATAEQIERRQGLIDYAYSIKDTTFKMLFSLDDYLLTRDLSSLKETEADFLRIGGNLRLAGNDILDTEESSLTVIKETTTAQEKAQHAMEEVRKAHQPFVETQQALEEAGQAVAAAVAQVMTHNQALQTDTSQRAQEIAHQADQAMTASSHDIGNAAVLNLIILAAAVILGLLLSWLLVRGINRVTRRVAQGLAASAESVALASSDLSVSSQELAEGSSEQAASLEETSASLEQLASMTRRNSESANQANQLMASTTQVADQAAHAMNGLSANMSQIDQASRQIEKIVKSIDEISFQTNLLALNAAVEAARAGEAGAGFAVVADEVRSLAMRAADASRNTQGLIGDTLVKVNAGVKALKETEEQFASLVQSTRRAAELVAEITAASAEQSQGIGQINQAVTQMDKATQGAASTAQKTAHGAESLRDMAEELDRLVGRLVALTGGDHHSQAQEEELPALAEGAAPAAALPPAQAAPAKAADKPRPQLPPGGKGKSRPQDVIPLDDDKDFADF